MLQHIVDLNRAPKAREIFWELRLGVFRKFQNRKITPGHRGGGDLAYHNRSQGGGSLCQLSKDHTLSHLQIAPPQAEKFGKSGVAAVEIDRIPIISTHFEMYF